MMKLLINSVAAIAAISHLVTATDATNDNDASVKRHRQRRHATERPTSDNNNNNIFGEEEHTNVFAVDVNSTKSSLTHVEYDGSTVDDKYDNDSGLGVTPYIVGGQAVNPPRKYGFFVSLGGCGGSLIAPNIVLSAAHCKGISETATLGMHKIDLPSGQSSEFYNIEHIPIAESITHPNYVNDSMDNDYWIIRLEYPSTLYADQIVELDTPSDALDLDDNEEHELVIFGFGTTSSGGDTPNIMQEATVDYITNDQCTKDPYNYLKRDITNNMMCAGRIGKDSCQGDSGGPIIHKETGKLVGIVSWGYGCADPKWPGVYARISTVYDNFIKLYMYKWSDAIYTQATTNAIKTNDIGGEATCTDSYNGGFYDRDGPKYNCIWYANDAATNCEEWGTYQNGGVTPNEACCACGGGTRTDTGGDNTPSPTPAPTVSPTASPTNRPTRINCESMGLGSSLVSHTNNADNHNRKTKKDRAAFGFFGGGTNRPSKCRRRNSFGGRRCRCRNGLDP